MECQICTNKAKKIVKCGFCDYETCSKCAETYLLDRALNPICMNCSKPWTRTVLAEQLGKTFLDKKFKTARQTAMFDREKAMFPETQAYIEENEPFIKRRMFEEFDADLRKLERFVIKCVTDLRNEYKRSYAKANVESHAEKLLLEISRYRRVNAAIAGLAVEPSPTKSKPKVVKVLTVKCANPECRGFVNAQNTRCGLCGAETCSKCRELAVTDHACDPSTVETVKLIKKDTKPCPKCFVPIHKIDGCDQMFCVACHGAFSWKTGEPTNDPIHNPHYFEYMRRNNIAIPRNPGDVQCGELQLPEIPRAKLTDDAYNFHRMMVHFDQVEVYKFRDTIVDNRILRVRYLENAIDEKTFAKKIQEVDKRCGKNREYRDILTTFVAAGSDILRAYATTDETEEWRVKCANGLIEYVNEQLLRVSKTYGSVLYRVNARRVELESETKRKMNSELCDSDQ